MAWNESSKRFNESSSKGRSGTLDSVNFEFSLCFVFFYMQFFSSISSRALMTASQHNKIAWRLTRADRSSMKMRNEIKLECSLSRRWMWKEFEKSRTSENFSLLRRNGQSKIQFSSRFEVEKRTNKSAKLRRAGESSEEVSKCLKTINTYKFYPLSDDGDLARENAELCGINVRRINKKIISILGIDFTRFAYRR